MNLLMEIAYKIRVRMVEKNEGGKQLNYGMGKYRSDIY